MTYYESAKGEKITKQRALKELRDHGITEGADIAAFLNECGDRPEYRAQAVLAWLGY